MLVPGHIRGVPGDRHIHAFADHNGDAFLDVIRAITAHRGTLSLRKRLLSDYCQLAGLVVILCADVSKAIDAGNNICGILAKAVKDDLQGLLPDFVGRLDNAYCSLGSRKRLMPRQKSEAPGFGK